MSKHRIEIGNPSNCTYTCNDYLEAIGCLIALRLCAFGDYAALDGRQSNDVGPEFEYCRDHVERTFMDRQLTDEEWTELDRRVNQFWESFDSAVIEDTPNCSTTDEALSAICHDYGWRVEVRAPVSINGQTNTDRLWWHAIDPKGLHNLSGPTAQSLATQVHRIAMMRRSEDTRLANFGYGEGMKRPTLRAGKYF